MTRDTEKIPCKTPTPGKAPTRIPKWKYDIIRNAITAILREEREVYFADLPEKTAARISDEDRKDIGSMAWHVTSIKLHMETEGELRRLPGKGRQRLALA